MLSATQGRNVSIFMILASFLWREPVRTNDHLLCSCTSYNNIKDVPQYIYLHGFATNLLQWMTVVNTLSTESTYSATHLNQQILHF